MEIKLGRPLTVGDKPIDALTLNLDALTGADVEQCAREAQIGNGNVPPVSLVLDASFHAQVAARACGLDVATLRKLGARDYLAVTTAVQGFLLGAD